LNGVKLKEEKEHEVKRGTGWAKAGGDDAAAGGWWRKNMGEAEGREHRGR
jgi:hypothetical protein